MNNNVTVSTNTANFASSRFVGSTVRDLRSNDLVVDELGLVGGEIAQIQRGGVGPWANASEGDVLNAGDVLLFSVAIGAKG